MRLFCVSQTLWGAGVGCGGVRSDAVGAVGCRGVPGCAVGCGGVAVRTSDSQREPGFESSFCSF